MLTLTQAVSQACLLDRPHHALEERMRAQGAHWFRLGALAESEEEGAPTIPHLASSSSDMMALPASPNHDHAKIGTHAGRRGLALEAGVNCGFALALPDGVGAAYSFAVRFSSVDANARTLVTLNPDKTDNYLFLQNNSGEFEFKDRKSTLETQAPAPGQADRPRLVIAGQSGDMLWLMGDDTAPVRHSAGRADLALGGPATVFIGCRSNRAGLIKTLGGFVMHDVMIWPDRNVLSPAESGTLAALRDAYRWED